MVWIKGSQCGIDNCNSQFYRVLSGRRICQNNHIQEGVEIGGDDDDFVAVGQKLRRPRGLSVKPSKADKESTTLRGLEAKRMVWELMQTVFQHQINFIKLQRDVPDTFEQGCREVWACFLQLYRNQKFNQTYLVALLYLCCRRVNVQVMIVDFNLWIHSSQLPYFETYRLLNPTKFHQLPPDLRRLFMPNTSRHRLHLHELTTQLKNELQRKYVHLHFIELTPNYVYFRMCQSLFFPPPVYVAAQIIHKLVPDPRSDRRSVVLNGELTAMCAVIVAAKLYLGLDDKPREIPPERLGAGFDWGVWHDMMRKIWLMRPDFSDVDEKLVHIWSGDQLDDYLSWYAKHMLSEKIEKRMSVFFPLPELDSTEADNCADAKTLLELCSLLYSTSEPDQGDPTDAKIIPPGQQYPSYSGNHESVGEVPRHFALILDVLKSLFNTDELVLRQALEQFETRIKRNYKKLLQGSSH